MNYEIIFCKGEYFNSKEVKKERLAARDESEALKKIYVMFWGTIIFVYAITKKYD